MLVRVGAVRRGIEPRLLHHVDPAVRERRAHVLGVRVVPGDDRVEALVARRVRIDGVQRHAVPERAQPVDRRDALGRVEVVEHRLGHQEVRRARPGVVLDLRHPHSAASSERSTSWRRITDPGGGRPVEEREPVAAGLRRGDDLAVVRKVERAAHGATSTVRSRAAASARSSAATFVSATAIT